MTTVLGYLVILYFLATSGMVLGTFHNGRKLGLDAQLVTRFALSLYFTLPLVLMQAAQGYVLLRQLRRESKMTRQYTGSVLDDQTHGVH